MAIDGKTSRRSHDRSQGAAPLHLVSAFATTARLVLAQEAVPDKANELAAIPPLLARLGAEDGLKGALVSIDAIATNADVARRSPPRGPTGSWQSRPTSRRSRAEVEAAFAAAEGLETDTDLDKGHGRIEERRMAVLREIGLARGRAPLPGRAAPPRRRLPHPHRDQRRDRGATRTETRYFISSRTLTATDAAVAVREHWAIENRLHWVLDVTFADDQSRLRKGHGARNMATVRHFALNLVRTATDKRSLKSRRKLAGWAPSLPQRKSCPHVRRNLEFGALRGGGGPDLCGDSPGTGGCLVRGWRSA